MAYGGRGRRGGKMRPHAPIWPEGMRDSANSAGTADLMPVLVAGGGIEG